MHNPRQIMVGISTVHQHTIPYFPEQGMTTFTYLFKMKHNHLSCFSQLNMSGNNKSLLYGSIYCQYSALLPALLLLY